MFDILKDKKILIIDDFGQFRATIKAMLIRLGTLDIDQAINGAKALTLCMENHYDIILCDYNLGEGQDGQQFLEELHERGILEKGVLFLMVTAETTSIQVMAAIEYRPDSYLTKPFTTEELGQRLKRLIKKNDALKPLHDAFNTKQYPQALKLCDSIAESYPRTKFSCLRIKTEIYEMVHHYDKALAVFQSVQEQQPLLWAILGEGRMYFAQDDYEKALHHFEEMSQNFPDQVNVLDWIAQCQNKLNMQVEVETTLLKAIKISPKSVRRQVALAEVAESLRHDEIAHQAYEKTISQGYHSCLLKPEHYRSYFQSTKKVVSQANGMTQARMLSRTEALAKKMESKYKQSPSALPDNLSSLSDLFASVGRNNLADDYLSKINTALNKPNCLINEGQLENLKHDMERIAASGVRTRSLDTLSSRMDELKDEIQQQKEHDLSAASLNSEGMALAKQSHLSEALNKFRKAINLSPNNPSYILNAAQIILLNQGFRSQPELVEEARSLLSSLSLETSGKHWRLYKKIVAYLPDE